MAANGPLQIQVLATNEEAARARAIYAATAAFGAERPAFIAFRQDELVGLDDERRLVYGWRALMHDAVATEALLARPRPPRPRSRPEAQPRVIPAAAASSRIHVACGSRVTRSGSSRASPPAHAAADVVRLRRAGRDHEHLARRRDHAAGGP